MCVYVCIEENIIILVLSVLVRWYLSHFGESNSSGIKKNILKELHGVFWFSMELGEVMMGTVSTLGVGSKMPSCIELLDVLSNC